jgi:hypothetical protein
VRQVGRLDREAAGVVTQDAPGDPAELGVVGGEQAVAPAGLAARDRVP